MGCVVVVGGGVDGADECGGVAGEFIASEGADAAGSAGAVQC